MELLELRDVNARKWLKTIGTPVRNTRIYISKKFTTKNGIVEPYGVFYPGNLKGYVFADTNINDIYSAYLHELFHGSFFENFPVGRKIQKIDKKVYEMEKELFGSMEISNIKVFVRPNLKSKSVKISDNAVEISDFAFKRYRAVSQELHSFYLKRLPLVEAFPPVLIEQMLGRDYTPTIPKAYRPAYEKLRTITKNHGIKEMISRLHRARDD